MPLAVAADGTLTASFTADKDGFYRIELDAPTGERVSASPQYTIDVLTDQPPTVSIREARAATRSASPIEEVFVEAQGGGRLRRQESRARLLRQRRRRKDDPALRRQEPAAPK